MHPLIDDLKTLRNREEARAYLMRQTTADIRDAYIAWMNGHKPQSRKAAVFRLVEITGAIADANAIRFL